MALAYIGLGSNVGDRYGHITDAIRELNEGGGARVTKVSSIYETEPVGPVVQPDFLNAVAEIETFYSPSKLLAVTKEIEERHKRVHGEHWGPRTVDLDILLYDDIEMTDDRLTLPHPEASKRAFVLVPLVEIAPDRRIGAGGKAKEILARLGKVEGVRLFRDRSEVEKAI